MGNACAVAPQATIEDALPTVAPERISAMVGTAQVRLILTA
jgi:hypothetical protein